MSQVEEELRTQIHNFKNELKQGKVDGSYNIAYGTVFLLRKLIATGRWNNAKELIDSIRSFGKDVSEAEPSEPTVGNIVRRVLKLVREEHLGTVGGDEHGGESLQKTLMAKKSEEKMDFTQPASNLKSAILEAVNEFVSELETCEDNIATQALEYIHSKEIIMTFGKSPVVERFLKNAARKRQFTVIIAECAPELHGHDLAKSLAESNIETIVIPDSAVFAIMSRVNKVIIGTHAVMADGSLKAVCGAHSVAVAAQHHSVPLIVCVGLYQLSPTFICSHDHDNLNKFLSPDPLKLNLPSGAVNLYNPTYDYISADLITLMISDVGGNAPSYLYRLLSEMYHQQDFEL